MRNMLQTVELAKQYIESHFSPDGNEIQYVQKDGYVEVDAPNVNFNVKLNLKSFKLFFGDVDNNASISFRVKFKRVKSIEVEGFTQGVSAENGPEYAHKCAYSHLITDAHLPKESNVLIIDCHHSLKEIKLNKVNDRLKIRRSTFVNDFKISWNETKPEHLDVVYVQVAGQMNVDFLPKSVNILTLKGETSGNSFEKFIANVKCHDITMSELRVHGTVRLVELLKFCSHLSQIKTSVFPIFDISTTDITAMIQSNALMYKNSPNVRKIVMSFTKELVDRGYNEYV